MKIVISRSYGKNETLGSLYVFDGYKVPFHCFTIELPDLNNQHQFSCIPEGIYDCEKCSTEKHPNSFLVKNVPGRDGIMIHIGNYGTGKKVDTEGCILPGKAFIDLNLDGNLDVSDSTIAMGKLNDILPTLFKLIII